LTVPPLFYQTLWVRILCLGILALLVAALFFGRIRQLTERQRKRFEQRMADRLNERTRIARELHDSLLQGFQGLMFRLQAVRQSLPARPVDAAQVLDLALQAGDQALIEGRQAVQSLRCTRELVAIVRDDIYRIVREAVRDAYEHARASHIETEIRFGETEFRVRVRDDGVGLEPEILREGRRAGHWGLPGMRERSEIIGGRLSVWSERNAGTEVELCISAAIGYALPARSGHS
jgi:signal transduction histidine kinase